MSLLLLLPLIVVIFLLGWVLQFQKNSTPPPSANQQKVEKGPPKKLAILVFSDVQLPTIDGLKAGLADLGYKENDNLVFDIKNAQGDRSLTASYAQELLKDPDSLVISVSTSATRAVIDARKQSNIQKPVIFVDVGNFQELGINDVSHPGNQLTGVVKEDISSAPKRVEILKEVVPQAKTFALLVNPKQVSYNETKKIHAETSENLNVKIKEFPISAQNELDSVLAAIVKDKPDGFLTSTDPLISGNAETITAALKKAKIPSIDFSADKKPTGYLLVYGISRFEVGKQGARVINKVLKGENPGDIPIEFASGWKLDVNESLAQEIGITIPNSIKIRASKPQ